MTDFTFGTPIDEYVNTGGGASSFLNYISDDVTQLQFLTEYDRLMVVHFHFDKDEGGKTFSYPCPGKDFKNECPGCLSGDKEVNRRTARIIVTARDEKSGYVNVYALPISLKETFERSWSRNDTILDRPYVIYRSKSGNRTTYEMEREDKYDEIPTVDFELPDPGEILKEMWKYGTDSVYRAEQKSERASKKSDEKIREEEPKKFERNEGKGEPAPFEDEDYPRGEITESELRGMSFIALINFAKENNLDIDSDTIDDKQSFVDAILNKMQ